MMFADRLRLPGPRDRRGGAYKDWLHVNVFDAASGTVLVLNGSLHGAADDHGAVAGATALIRHGGQWVAHHETVPRSRATTGDHTLAVGDRLVLQLDPVTGGVLTTYRHPPTGLAVRLEATPRTRAVQPAPAPFGSGWIAWRAVPVLESKGHLLWEGRRIGLDDALAYHDHNWGRWRWGEDIGWEWAAWPSGDGALVMSRATDRVHSRGAPTVTLALPGRRGWQNRSYGVSSVGVRLTGWRRGCRRRVPGAMAALHAERSRPRLPGTVEIRVDDGFDHVTARLDVDDVVQVITAEPSAAGYSYVHEMFGPFRARGVRAGERFSFRGQGAFEYVD